MFGVIETISVLLNVVFVFLFLMISSFFKKPGEPNFFMQTVKVILNRVRNPTLCVGATNDRGVSIWWKGENDPIAPKPNYKGLSLQFEPRNQFHGWKGLPVIFAFESFLSNNNPLESGNNDVETELVSYANEAYVNAEVMRKTMLNEPFKKLEKVLVVQMIVMILGFIVLGYLLITAQASIDQFTSTATESWESIKPAVETFLANNGNLNINETLSDGVVKSG